jgi:hypothetical protein
MVLYSHSSSFRRCCKYPVYFVVIMEWDEKRAKRRSPPRAQLLLLTVAIDNCAASLSEDPIQGYHTIRHLTVRGPNPWVPLYALTFLGKATSIRLAY